MELNDMLPEIEFGHTEYHDGRYACFRHTMKDTVNPSQPVGLGETDEAALLDLYDVARNHLDDINLEEVRKINTDYCNVLIRLSHQSFLADLILHKGK